MSRFSNSHRCARLLTWLNPLMVLLALACFASGATAQFDRLLAPVEAVPQEPGRLAAREGTSKAEMATPAVVAPAEKAAESRMFTSEDLLREIKAQVLEHYGATGDLVLDMARPWGAVKVPASGVVLKIMDYPRDGLATLMNIQCKITADDQVIGEWSVTVRAQLWQDVWVASNRLERGQQLDETMANLQKVDILLNRNALLGADEKLSTYEMAQNVNTGAPLMKRDVAEKPVIRKNQIVEAVVRRRALSITMKAQALENGAPKALIRMRNLDSKREFNAQVVNETQVNVVF